MNDNAAQPEKNSGPEIGRNEPCPCGSGKKYKRCHGVAAAPKLSQPKMAANIPEGFDPSTMSGAGGMPAMPPGLENMSPEMMAQVASMLQRLPKGQLQRLQTLMQKAMAGKDVTREAEEFQKTLPPEFQHMLMSMAPAAAMAAQQQGGGAGAFGGMAGIGEAASSRNASSVSSGDASSVSSGDASSVMTEEDARRIVAEAAAAGKISDDQAAGLLESPPSPGVAIPGENDKSGKGLGKFWRNITKK